MEGIQRAVDFGQQSSEEPKEGPSQRRIQGKGLEDVHGVTRDSVEEDNGREVFIMPDCSPEDKIVHVPLPRITVTKVNLLRLHIER